MTGLRETMRALLSLAFCVLLAASASAQSFPSRPLRMLVPAPPAGITDLSARLVAEGLRVRFNQSVIVENKPGGNGVIAVRELLKAEPDGCTLLVGAMGMVVLGYAMEVNPPFDALRDLSPIHKIDRVKAPTIVLHGANDTNVPVIEAEQVVESLQQRGVPLEYVLFPDEGHGFNKTPNRIRAVVAIVRWFVSYLKR